MHRGCFCTCAPRCQQHEGVPSLSHPRPHPIPGTLRMDTTWQALVPAWARGGSASASPKSPMAHVPSSRTSTFWLLRSRCTTLGLYRPGRWDWGGVSQDGEGDTLAEAGRTRRTSGRTHRRARAPGAGKRGRGRGREPGARCRPTSPRAAPGNVAGSPGDTRGDTRGDTGQLPPPHSTCTHPPAPLCLQGHPAIRCGHGHGTTRVGIPGTHVCDASGPRTRTCTPTCNPPAPTSTPCPPLAATHGGVQLEDEEPPPGAGSGTPRPQQPGHVVVLHQGQPVHGPLRREASGRPRHEGLDGHRPLL